MKKIYFLLFMLCGALILNAQEGDTINDAILVDGTSVSVSVLDYTTSTQSGLVPSCVGSEDVFYKHTSTSGDNKLIVGMTSAGLTAIANIDYQIFVVPTDEPTQLQELECDFYTVFALVGGSFEFVIEDVNVTNNYYLRVYKSTDAGASLSTLLNGTTITMMSEYDSTLSIGEVEQEGVKYVVKNDKIEFYNNANFNQFQIFGLDGKQVLENRDNDIIQAINIAHLSKGIYVMNLSNDTTSKIFKFVRH